MAQAPALESDERCVRTGHRRDRPRRAHREESGHSPRGRRSRTRGESLARAGGRAEHFTAQCASRPRTASIARAAKCEHVAEHAR